MRYGAAQFGEGSRLPDAAVLVEAIASSKVTKMHSVGVVVAPGLQLMSMAALAVFQAANVLKEGRIYDVHLLSQAGGLVPTAAGFTVGTETISNAVYDTLLVAASAVTAPSPEPIVGFVRRAGAEARRVASLCTGAFTLAQAGFLSDRRATTHWRHARELQARFPDIRIETDRLFVNDGPVWTSAGMMAGIDMVLALVEVDLGSDVARIIARRMVLDRRRPGGQPQVSSLLELEPRSDRLQRALDHIRANLRDELSVGAMAKAASLSPRQLTRVFGRELGETPARVVERLRGEAAKALVIEGRRSIKEIADHVGFADRERMRRVFLRLYGRPPQGFRETDRTGAIATGLEFAA